MLNQISAEVNKLSNRNHQLNRVTSRTTRRNDINHVIDPNVSEMLPADQTSTLRVPPKRLNTAPALVNGIRQTSSTKIAQRRQTPSSNSPIFRTMQGTRDELGLWDTPLLSDAQRQSTKRITKSILGMFTSKGVVQQPRLVVSM